MIDLGRGWRKFKRGVKNGFSSSSSTNATATLGDGQGEVGGKKRGGVRRGWSQASSEGSEVDPSRAWRGSSEEPESPRYGGGESVDRTVENGDEDEEDDDEEETSRYCSFLSFREPDDRRS